MVYMMQTPLPVNYRRNWIVQCFTSPPTLYRLEEG